MTSAVTGKCRTGGDSSSTPATTSSRIIVRLAALEQLKVEPRKGGHKVPKGRRRSKVYATPFGLRTATRDHPWTGSSSRGKRTWTKAALTIERKTPQRVHEQTTAVIGQHFKRG